MSLFVRDSALIGLSCIPSSGARAAITQKNISPGENFGVAATAQDEGTGLPEGVILLTRLCAWPHF